MTQVMEDKLSADNVQVMTIKSDGVHLFTTEELSAIITEYKK